jgi:NTE family protein
MTSETLSPSPTRRANTKRISLALQGGGSHGAFTWGVLHRLLSDPRLYIDGLSGTSAGAMNAAVLVDGFIKGKRQGAIDAMEAFWTEIGRHVMLPRSNIPALLGMRETWQVDQEPAFIWADFLSRLFSPSQMNPMNNNPLRNLLQENIDFEAIRGRPDIKLFVTASNVMTCQPKIFRTTEMTADCLMASACLPTLFPAVEIDGQHYWDGGYLGNPSIRPLIHECGSSDIMLIRINPMICNSVPRTAREILNRMNEMSFNATLVREMHSIATVSRFVQEGKLDDDRYTTVRFHEITAEQELAGFGALSKMNNEPKFLRHLHDLGYEAATVWLDQHYETIGWDSTLDVMNIYREE